MKRMSNGKRRRLDSPRAQQMDEPVVNESEVNEPEVNEPEISEDTTMVAVTKDYAPAKEGDAPVNVNLNPERTEWGDTLENIWTTLFLMNLHLPIW